MTPKTEAEFRIQLALPWLLRLPDSTYECRRGRSQYLVNTTSCKTSPGGAASTTPGTRFAAMTGQLTAADDAQVPGAMLSHTRVTLTFLKRIPGPKATDEDFQRVLTIAYRGLNHFLDVYRLVAKDTEVRSLSRTEFHQVRAGHGLLLQSNIKRADSHCTFTSGVFFDEKDPMVLGVPTPIEDASLEELRDHLKEGHVPPLSALLLLNAEMYLRAGLPRLAVIDMNAALDVVVEQKAKYWLLHSGDDLTGVDQRLERLTVVPMMEQILLPNLRIPDGADFPWKEWRETFRRLRNRVVHDAYDPTDEEAQASFDNVGRLCHFLDSLVIGTEDDALTED